LTRNGTVRALFLPHSIAIIITRTPYIILLILYHTFGEFHLIHITNFGLYVKNPFFLFRLTTHDTRLVTVRSVTMFSTRCTKNKEFFYCNNNTNENLIICIYTYSNIIFVLIIVNRIEYMSTT